MGHSVCRREDTHKYTRAPPRKLFERQQKGKYLQKDLYLHVCDKIVDFEPFRRSFQIKFHFGIVEGKARERGEREKFVEKISLECLDSINTRCERIDV